ncbi:MAG: RNA polymerase factor sigma-54 [Betaproteobacteria bacterium]|nr:RNA polymerase factor sigma-54 [Betaproteobacteria bacterium]
MKTALQFKLSQQLALTPQLQQSIRLLQLSTLELNQEIEQMLAENPLLERDDDPLGECVSISANGTLDPPLPQGLADLGGTPAETAQRNDESDREADTDSSGSNSDGDDAPADWGHDSGSRSQNDDDDEREYPQLAGAGVSLVEHLREQLSATRLERRDRALIELLIDELDRDGMLNTSLDEFREALPAELEIDPDEVAAALKLLQSFDPPGVAARNLRECLLLQLAQTGHDDPEVMAIARAIVVDHLELLAARDFVRLRRVLQCDEDSLRQAHTLIRSLEPRPGARFGSDDAGYVVPDVIVRRTRAGWTAVLNPDVMPKLRVNDMYADILRRNRGSASGNLSGPLQEARWMIKNIAQRFDTILRVSQAIVERQRGFFSHGAVAMRPLVLREIADTLDLHESTISRVTTQKYMLTPHGTFELKYFFGSHVATDTGGAASSTAIRALIKQLIGAEDARRPLSDSQIADMLGEQGIVVARRTVAKYRESLRIAPVAQRKSL